jgi:hypothetical protein
MRDLPRPDQDIVQEYVRQGILKVDAKTGRVLMRTRDWSNAFKLQRGMGDIPSRATDRPIVSW